MEAIAGSVAAMAGWLYPALTTIVLALPGGLLGSIASIVITERLKGRQQRELERIKSEYQTALEGSKNEYQRALEQLKSELARSTERVRSQLAAVSFEHQTRFSRLHQNRVEVISELYRKLVRAEVAFSTAVRLFRAGPSKQEIEDATRQDGEAAAAAINELLAFFRENRIWLDPSLTAKIGEATRVFTENWVKYISADDALNRHREWRDAWRNFNEQAPAIREEIEAMMRNILDAPPPMLDADSSEQTVTP